MLNYKDKDPCQLTISLWNACSNNCIFCYNNGIRHLPEDIYLHLNLVKWLLTSKNMDDCSSLAFLGGELLDDSPQKLNVEKEFYEILELATKLVFKEYIEKIVFLTNLIFEDRKNLDTLIKFFKDKNILHKLEINTSYDKEGRFTEKTRQIWWNNYNYIRNTYPQINIGIQVIITQPLIENMTKEIMDNFHEKTKGSTIRFNQLDISAEPGINKYNACYSHLFPKRKDFIKFIKLMKNWGYFKEFGALDVKYGNPVMQFILSKELNCPMFKEFSSIEREDYKEDGYIDSDIPLDSDIINIYNNWVNL